MTGPPGSNDAGAARRRGPGSVGGRAGRILVGIALLLFLAGMGRFMAAMAKKLQPKPIQITRRARLKP